MEGSQESVGFYSLAAEIDQATLPPYAYCEACVLVQRLRSLNDKYLHIPSLVLAEPYPHLLLNCASIHLHNLGVVSRVPDDADLSIVTTLDKAKIELIRFAMRQRV